MTPADPWDPDQYHRFQAERRQPFDDLLGVCQRIEGGYAVDLGCGSGELTKEIHLAMGAKHTVGVDTSAAMLEKAPTADGLSFVLESIEQWQGSDVDLLTANASLHWVTDHEALLARLRRSLAPSGQLAFQVPANFAHPSHVLARELAAESPFIEALGGSLPIDRATSILTPEGYAEVLYELGASAQKVRLEVYGHVLDWSGDVVDWVKGTLLTPYRAGLDDASYGAFIDEFARRFIATVGDRRPYFYGFARILCWARFD